MTPFQKLCTVELLYHHGPDELDRNQLLERYWELNDIIYHHRREWNG